MSLFGFRFRLTIGSLFPDALLLMRVIRSVKRKLRLFSLKSNGRFVCHALAMHTLRVRLTGNMSRTDKRWFVVVFLAAMVVLTTNAWLLWENINNPMPKEWRWLAEVGEERTIVEIDGVYYSVTEVEYEE